MRGALAWPAYSSKSLWKNSINCSFTTNSRILYRALHTPSNPREAKRLKIFSGIGKTLRKTKTHPKRRYNPALILKISIKLFIYHAPSKTKTTSKTPKGYPLGILKRESSMGVLLKWLLILKLKNSLFQCLRSTIRCTKVRWRNSDHLVYNKKSERRS